MERDAHNIPLYAKLERAKLDRALAGIDLNRDQLQTVLSIDAGGLDQRNLALGRLAVVLPLGALRPAQKAFYARRRWDGQPRLIRLLVDGLTACPGVAGALRLPPPVLSGLVVRDRAYRNYMLLGQRMKNSGMDMRLVLGAFMWFLADRVAAALERRITDPATPPREREALLGHFGPGLLLLERILRHPVERKEEIGARRDKLGAELKEKQAQAALAGVIVAVDQGLPVERPALFEAARLHLAAQGQGVTGAPEPVPPVGGTGPAKAPEAPGKGPRILR